MRPSRALPGTEIVRCAISVWPARSSVSVARRPICTSSGTAEGMFPSGSEVSSSAVGTFSTAPSSRVLIARFSAPLSGLTVLSRSTKSR